MNGGHIDEEAERLPPRHDLNEEAGTARFSGTQDASKAEDLRVLKLQEQLDEMQDRWMCSEADRSRATREVDHSRLFEVQTFATDVVKVAENFRRGLKSIPTPTSSDPAIVTRHREGCLSIEGLLELLGRNGLAGFAGRGILIYVLAILHTPLMSGFNFVHCMW